MDTMNNNNELKIIGWIATGLSFVGIMLNTYQMIECWLVWSMPMFFGFIGRIKKENGHKLFYGLYLHWLIFMDGMFGHFNYKKIKKIGTFYIKK